MFYRGKDSQRWQMNGILCVCIEKVGKGKRICHRKWAHIYKFVSFFTEINVWWKKNGEYNVHKNIGNKQRFYGGDRIFSYSYKRSSYETYFVVFFWELMCLQSMKILQAGLQNI